MVDADTKLKAADLQRIARDLSGNLSGIEKQMFIWRPRICPFHRLVEYAPLGAKMLDIGCGNGLWLHLLRRLEQIEKGTGIEIDADRIESAKRIAGNGTVLAFQVYRPEDPWPAAECDTISMIDVIHHVPSEKQMDFLGQIKDTPARTVLFKDIDPASPFKASMNTLHDLVVSRQKPRYPDRSAVRNKLEEIGFTVEADFRCDVLWYSHYAIIAKR